ncbi:MAG: tyrosine-type recombinase/integrase [Deltaproteobacteria bacterium]|nr:tyrosine-type recombinase/integrase [Deltaproteobacteria bacterium]MBW2002746.1 tyrosine-type recombinase/integrase [Deltaproteobacteria bacterium]
MVALLDEYQHELSRICGFAEDTVENYVSCIVSFCAWVKDEFHISPIDVQGSHVLKWMMELKDRGLSYSRLEHHRSALRNFYAMLLKMKVVKKNVASALPRLRKRGISSVMPVSSKTVERLLDIVDQSTWIGKRNYMIISMLWTLGLRISELTGLRVGCFEPYHDPEDRIGLLRVKGKNRKQRALFVVDKLYDNLIAYLAHPQSPKQKIDPLFPVANGKAISNDRVQKKMKEYCREAGITERIMPHVLRHSFATDMYHANVPLEAIQAMMGHNRKSETAAYIKVSDQFEKNALAQLTIGGRVTWQ